MKEVSLNRYAGPFDEVPYHNFIQSPIGLVPKAGNQTRLIFHLSYNFGDNLEKLGSVNHFTPKEMCTVKYNDLDHAIKASLKLAKESQTNKLDPKLIDHIGEQIVATIFYSKSDLKSAFRLVPILAGQRCWLIMMTVNPNNGKIVYFADKNLPFGASVSCSRFTLFSEALRHVFEHATGRYNAVTNYLDDFLFIATDEQECNQMVRNFLELCHHIGCPVSLDKTEWASSRMIFLGLMLNGQTYTLSVPLDKKLKAERLIDYAMDKKKVTIKFVQSLAGTLNFLNRAIVPGRAFTRCMYDRLKTTTASGIKLKQHHHINLGTGFLRDCLIWKEFLAGSIFKPEQLCRPFVDIDTGCNSETLNFYTDSSLNKNLGYGGIFNRRWMIGKWGSSFITEQSPSIQFLELYALVAGIVTWGNMNNQEGYSLRNTRVDVFCDNKSVMYMVNTHNTHCGQMHETYQDSHYGQSEEQ